MDEDRAPEISRLRRRSHRQCSEISRNRHMPSEIESHRHHVDAPGIEDASIRERVPGRADDHRLKVPRTRIGQGAVEVTAHFQSPMFE